MKTILLSALVCFAVAAHAADNVRVKLGTLAPKDSTPHQALKVMGEKWKAHGAQLTIFTDGTQGGEADMVKRMQIGQLQAAMLTGVGLSEIDSSVTALQTMPLIFRSFEELDFVRSKLAPKIEKQLADKGYVVLFWADAGWVRYFSRKPVLFPEDLKKQKLFAWAGDAKTLDIVKAAGYQPIPLETADILPGLKTGLIDAVPMPPFFALAGQIYEPAPHMLEMNWAPLVGAGVITKKTWDKFPADAQKAMLAAAAKAGDEIRAQLRKEMDESVAAMQKRGLKVTKLTPEAAAAWDQLAATVHPKIRGAIVPSDLFDEVQVLLKEFRSRPAAQP